MKRILLLSAVMFGLSLNIAQSKNLKARFAYATFYTPEKGPFIETYLSVEGSSVNYVATVAKLRDCVARDTDPATTIMYLRQVWKQIVGIGTWLGREGVTTTHQCTHAIRGTKERTVKNPNDPGSCAA